jgi:hypothetical protein
MDARSEQDRRTILANSVPVDIRFRETLDSNSHPNLVLILFGMDSSTIIINRKTDCANMTSYESVAYWKKWTETQLSPFVPPVLVVGIRSSSENLLEDITIAELTVIFEIRQY